MSSWIQERRFIPVIPVPWGEWGRRIIDYGARPRLKEQGYWRGAVGSIHQSPGDMQARHGLLPSSSITNLGGEKHLLVPCFVPLIHLPRWHAFFRKMLFWNSGEELKDDILIVPKNDLKASLTYCPRFWKQLAHQILEQIDFILLSITQHYPQVLISLIKSINTAGLQDHHWAAALDKYTQCYFLRFHLQLRFKWTS